MHTRQMHTPFHTEDILSLKAGDNLLLSGVMYTARDAAHQRWAETLEKGLPLPVGLAGQTLYYMGPSPAPPGRAVGACGPTTSRRMDRYTLPLLKQGIKAMIGKGERSPETKRDIENYGAVYLVTLGGAGALLAGRVKKVETICYPELMAEAVMRLEVEDFPAICAYDARGGDIFSLQTARYRRI